MLYRVHALALPALALVAVATSLSASPAHAMGKKLINASDAYNKDTKPLQKVALDKKRVNVDVTRREVAGGDDWDASLTLLRTSDTPNDVRIKIVETDPLGNYTCTKYETKTYHGEDSSCGTGVRYVNDCRDERECCEKTIETPGQPPQKITTCETIHRCGVYPQAYTLTCDYQRNECVDGDFSATQSDSVVTLKFVDAAPLAAGQTEELEYVFTYGLKTGSNLLRVNRSQRDYQVKRVKKFTTDFRLKGIVKK